MLKGNWKAVMRRVLLGQGCSCPRPAGTWLSPVSRMSPWGLACAKPACVERERWLCQQGCLGRLLDLGEELEHCHSHIALVAGLLRWADIAVSHEHTLTLCQGMGDALPLTLMQF